jgi:3-dehydroquinate dehydratase-2
MLSLKPMNILLLHGPNLNLLGKREPHIYGGSTLLDIEKKMQKIAQKNNILLRTFQSNAEHQLLDYIQQSMNDGTQMIIINPAAFTHTSIAIRDALLGVALPFIEVHLSNIYARESFRHHSFFSDIAIGTISGFGEHSYILALNAAMTYLQSQRMKNNEYSNEKK